MSGAVSPQRLFCAAVRWVLLLSMVAVLIGVWTSPTANAEDPAVLFGDGSDGPITFSTNTQFNPPVDAVVTSGAGSTLTLASPSGAFLPGQKVLIHQTRGSGAGTWELNSVQSYVMGTLTTSAALAHTYVSSGANRAQVLVVPQYSNVTVNAGVTVTAKPWNGTVGGILAFLANGTVTVDGTISANEMGYLGAASGSGHGAQGEGTVGDRGTQSSSANGNGGGGGDNFDPVNHPGGGGGGNGTAGIAGSYSSHGQGARGIGGSTAGTSDLTTAVFGGGGGAKGVAEGHRDAGDGGGLILISGATINSAGTITSNGELLSGSNGGQGGGAGGSILLKAQTASLGTTLVTAVGGAGGTSQDENNGAGGAGGNGRIRVEYCQSISGGFADPTASIAHISCLAPGVVGGIAEPPDVAESAGGSSSLPFGTLAAIAAAGALAAAAACCAWRWRSLTT